MLSCVRVISKKGVNHLEGFWNLQCIEFEHHVQELSQRRNYSTFVHRSVAGWSNQDTILESKSKEGIIVDPEVRLDYPLRRKARR